METVEIFCGVALFIFLLGAFMYILIMGPSRYHRNGIVGRTYDFLMDLPGIFCSCFFCLFYRCSYTRGRKKWRQCSDYTFQERNPLMVIFYVVLVWSVEAGYLLFALPQLRAPLWSKFVSWALVLLAECFYGLAVFSDPGVVTSREEIEARDAAFAKHAANKKRAKSSKQQQAGEEKGKGAKRRTRAAGSGGGGSSSGSSVSSSDGHKNENGNRGPEAKREQAKKKEAHRKFLLSPEAEARQNRRYVVDGILFAVNTIDSRNNNGSREYSPETSIGTECITCHVPRPSRSKHCRLCGHCVRRFDHHCPWINNDVAENTYRWFLIFIFFHAVSCMWASWDICAIMKDFLVENRAWGWKVILAGGQFYRLSVVDYILILVSYKTFLSCLLFFAFVIGIVLWVFWIYQMSFAVRNLTMNDMFKIDDAAMFISSLPTLTVVHREASNARQRLELILGRPPRRLQDLKEPAADILPGSREDRAYRNEIRGMLSSDLRDMFNRGVWRNLMEVMFPYSYGAHAEKRVKQN